MDNFYEQLEAALCGLAYQSESDYPLELVHWKRTGDSAVNAEFVRAQLEQGPDINIEEQDAQKFLQECCLVQPWFGDEERVMARRFKALQDLLNAQLKYMQLFRLGETEVTIVLVGQDSSGDVSGFKTISVET